MRRPKKLPKVVSHPLHRRWPLMTRLVLSVLRSKPDKRWTATQVAREIGVPSPSKYGVWSGDGDRVREAGRRVERLLRHLDNIGWVNERCARANTYHLTTKRTRSSTAAHQRSIDYVAGIAQALAVPGWDPGDTYISISASAAQLVFERLAAMGVAHDGPASQSVTFTLHERQARVLLELLDPADHVERAVHNAIEIGVARNAAHALGEQPCSACCGAGVVHHEDVNGWHSWTCDRCEGGGIDPALPPLDHRRSLQRSKRGFTCGPECLGYECVVGPEADLVPDGFVELQACDECGLLTDRAAALQVAAARAVWVDVRTGERGRVVLDGDAGRELVVYAVPTTDAVACDLELPGAGVTA